MAGNSATKASAARIYIVAVVGSLLNSFCVCRPRKATPPLTSANPFLLACLFASGAFSPVVHTTNVRVSLLWHHTFRSDVIAPAFWPSLE